MEHAPPTLPTHRPRRVPSPSRRSPRGAGGRRLLESGHPGSGRATGADAGEDVAARGGRAGGSTHARGEDAGTRGGRGQSADTEYRPAKEKTQKLRPHKSCARRKKCLPHAITKQRAKCQPQRSRPRPACPRPMGRGRNHGRQQAERYAAPQAAPEGNAQGERTAESSPGRNAP